MQPVGEGPGLDEADEEGRTSPSSQVWSFLIHERKGGGDWAGGRGGALSLARIQTLSDFQALHYEYLFCFSLSTSARRFSGASSPCTAVFCTFKRTFIKTLFL